MLAVSTFCRSCGSHFEISAETFHRPPAGKAAITVSRLFPQFGRKTPTTRGNAAGNTSNSSLALKEAHPPVTGQKRDVKTRSVRCFDCDLSHKTPCDASSTICPHCSSYISLEDIVLTDQQTREIRTRGDVTIKKGVTLVGGISCHNLRVYGKVIGRLDCSGKLDFHASGRMLGEVKAAVLEIHRKCCLHFVHEVRANEVLVHGEAHGEFLCDGRLHIGRKGALYGAIVPRSVFVETGGTLSGNLQILSDRPRKSVSPGTPAPSISAQRLAPDSPTAVPA